MAGAVVVVAGMITIDSSVGLGFSTSGSSSSSSSQPTSSSSRVVAPNINQSPLYPGGIKNIIPLSNSFRFCSSISSSFLKK